MPNRSKHDLLWAGAAGLIALAVYVRTLAPGLVDIVDTPMFQFVGRVLGVAHNPGYPTYVLLTYPFSYLPIGSLAYRINLFSAVLGAITVFLTFLIARRLHCRIVVALAAALGLAFGPIFWSQSVIAEVYTLNAAIVVGCLLALFTWGCTGRHGFFFLAIGLFSIGLGNHVTIVGFAPSIAVYAVLTDRGFATRLRTMVVATVLVLVGLLQYGFIILRSHQPGAYLESQAKTISALLDVMRGKQFGQMLFAFDWKTVVTERFAWLLGRVLVPELTLPGFMLALVGAAIMVRRQTAHGLMLMLGCISILGFALNFSTRDVQVFVIPAILVFWITAAVGVEQVTRLVAGRAPRAGSILAAVSLAVPTWSLVHNFAANDLSQRIETQVYVDRLFERVPDRTVFVREDFLVDRMLSYKLLGENAANGREIMLAHPGTGAARVQALLDNGFNILAFSKMAYRLRWDAIDVDFAPYSLLDVQLPEFLSRLPEGSLVALGVPAIHAAQFAATGAALFGSLGGPNGLAGLTPSNVALVGVKGARHGAIDRVSGFDVDVSLAAGEPVGTTGYRAPSAIQIGVDSLAAFIRLDSREIARTSEGVVFAVWKPDGSLNRSFVLQAFEDFRVPLPVGPLSVRPLRGVWPSVPVSSSGWADLTPMAATGSVMATLPPGSAVVVYLCDDTPLAPRVFDQSPTQVRFQTTTFDRREDLTWQAAVRRDGVREVEIGNAEYLYRIQMSVPDTEAAPVSVEWALGGVPERVAALTVRQGASTKPAKIFMINTNGLLRTPDRISQVLGMARDDQRQLVGAGWEAVEADAVGPYRRMAGVEGRLLLPLTRADASRIVVEARRGDDPNEAPSTVRLSVNGIRLSEQLLVNGWHAYEWILPPDTLRRGTNEVSISVDELLHSRNGTIPSGLAVAQVRVISDRS